MTVKAVAARDPFPIDDEFAKGMGSESLDKLKETIKDRIAAEYARVSRDKVKRELLDRLDRLYSFELPEGLVTQEFNSIWEQVTREQQASGRSFADENTTEEAARADYRKIAERRVRLGLLLAEVGTRAEVKVSDEEMTQALVARARSFPGQEKQVWDFYRNNNQALAELRAPIYEEKVVDHILGLAKVEARSVPKEELLKAGRRRASDRAAGLSDQGGARLLTPAGDSSLFSGRPRAPMLYSWLTAGCRLIPAKERF